MKQIIKIFTLCILTIVAFSCSESDLIIDDVYDNVDNSGAFIRTLNAPSTGPHNVSGGALPNSIDMTLEIQEGNGSSQPNFKEVRVYMSPFNDQDQEFPTLDANGNEIGETLLDILLPAQFEPSEVNGLPSTDVSIPTQQVVEILEGAQFTFPTFIYVRLELEMNDGRIFTVGSVGPNVENGNFYSTPFFYNIIFLNV